MLREQFVNKHKNLFWYTPEAETELLPLSQLWKKIFTMNKLLQILFLAVMICGNADAARTKVKAPAPFGATPSPRQMAWHDMKFYAFVHFTLYFR